MVNLSDLRAKRIQGAGPEGPFRHVDYMDELMDTLYEGELTVDKIFDASVRKHSQEPCLGTREVLLEEFNEQPDGKMHKKVKYGKYTWQNYEDVSKRVRTVGHGLAVLGMKPKMKLGIFLETKAEWLITCHACFRNNYPIVTVYATLDEHGITHALKETEVTHVITSTTLLKTRLANCLQYLPELDHIVVVENGSADDATFDELGQPGVHKIITFEHLEKLGHSRTSLAAAREIPLTIAEPPTKDDLAVIMYTSGQSGEPKGVLISHSNFVAAMSGIASRVPNLGPEDVYIGYLPLAHVLELAAENIMVASGARIGYSSPLTLTNNSAQIMAGTKGDASALKPTLMACVPEIMERMRKTVNQKMEGSPQLAKALFHSAYNYKLQHIERGRRTSVVNKIVFKKTRKIIGGHVRALLSGGAPLNAGTQAFMNVCMCCPVVQGYGLTETCGATSVTEIERDFSYGRTGPPLPCTEIKLVPWEEGGYKPTETPPRGEIHVGGPSVAQGYYKKPEKTAEDFYVDEDGKRWFKTGDIGQFDIDGCLRVVDRKKDLVKLSRGEYIALGNIESKLKSSALIDNIWVYADSEQDHCVAFVVPNETALRGAIGTTKNESLEALCEENAVIELLKKAVADAAANANLQKYEIPQEIQLEAHPWLPEDGLTTASFKLKRKSLENHYHQNIEGLYAS